MLNLFKSLFTSAPPESGAYPESIVQLAIERAVDVTDKRIRLLPGFKDKLRPAVLRAIDHVVALLDRLHPPVELSNSAYSADARVSAFFASPQRIAQMLGSDQAFVEFRDGRDGRIADRALALLVLEHAERKVLGMELQGEQVRREVAQTVVSFSGHRLLDPAMDPDAHRKLLRRRAFDHLLERALASIASSRASRGALERELVLLQRKLDTLEASPWSFEPCTGEEVPCPLEMESRIEQIEDELDVLGGNTDTLDHHLGQVIEVLENADTYLRMEQLSLILDPMGVVKEREEANARELHLHEIHLVNGQKAILLPVEIPREEWPQPKDFLAQAQRFLG